MGADTCSRKTTGARGYIGRQSRPGIPASIARRVQVTGVWTGNARDQWYEPTWFVRLALCRRDFGVAEAILACASEFEECTGRRIDDVFVAHSALALDGRGVARCLGVGIRHVPRAHRRSARQARLRWRHRRWRRRRRRRRGWTSALAHLATCAVHIISILNRALAVVHPNELIARDVARGHYKAAIPPLCVWTTVAPI